MRKFHITLVLAAFVVGGCATGNRDTQSGASNYSNEQSESESAVTKGTITISDNAEYYDEKVIPSNIRSECTALRSGLSDSAEKSLSQIGWNVVKSDTVGGDGLSLKLMITTAHSSGNAYFGHKKSVSVEAELYKDGELLDSFSGTRNSGGGFGAGFKGSCTVLQRCVHTLGKDVSNWLSKKKL